MSKKDREFLLKLEKVFQDMSINVKYDKLKGDGGYCKYKDKEYVIINKILPDKTKSVILKKILNQMIKNEDIYIVPEIRDILEKDENENN